MDRVGIAHMKNEKLKQFLNDSEEILRYKDHPDFGLTEKEAKEMGFIIIKFPNEKTQMSVQKNK
jgi:hypothetical protein